MNTGHLLSEETICAIATPPGNAGVCVIRISGVDSLKILKSVFKKNDSNFIPRHVYFGNVFSKTGQLDEGLAVFFPAPKSYTGEDMAELHIHGGSVSPVLCLEAIVSCGARLAQPGEFSKRAFINGKLDLIKAESVMDLISAKTKSQAKNAMHMMTGALSRKVSEIIEKTTFVLAYIEAIIEYPEEEFDENSDDIIKQNISEIISMLDNLKSTYDRGNILKNGFRVALVGLPNVGKSSLLNALTGKDSAIVTHIPGTTRDVIECQIVINNVPVILSDTAGVRQTSDVIEKMGVEKTMLAIDSSHLTLLVTDASKELSPEELELINKTEDVLIVRNKSDLGVVPFDGECIIMSVKNNENLDTLLDAISKRIVKINDDECLITNQRHFSALENARNSADMAYTGVCEHVPFDLCAIDLRDVRHFLGSITGTTVDEDIIDTIFSQFCLGK